MLVPPYDIHRQIFLIRKFSGLNQIEMSKRLDITQGWLSKLESGMGEITVTQLIQLRKHFALSADDIVDGRIDYRELATRFGTRIALPEKYSSRPTLKMRALYGVIGLLEKETDARSAARQIRGLGFKPHLLAIPDLEINSKLLYDVMEICAGRGLLSRSGALREIARICLSPGALGKELNRFTDAGSPREVFTRFAELYHLFTVGSRVTVEPSNDTAAEIAIEPSEQFRDLLAQNPELSRLFWEYTQVLLKEYTRWAAGRELSVVRAAESGSETATRYEVELA